MSRIVLTHSPLAGFLIAVLVLSVLAHLSYTYFEMPIRRALTYKGSGITSVDAQPTRT